MKINILNLTNKSFDIAEELPDADERIIVGPLGFNPHHMPKFYLMNEIGEMMKQLLNTPNFSPLDTTYLILESGSDLNLDIQDAVLQAFFLLGGNVITWTIGKERAIYTAASETRSVIIDCVLEYLHNKDLNEQQRFFSSSSISGQ